MICKRKLQIKSDAIDLNLGSLVFKLVVNAGSTIYDPNQSGPEWVHESLFKKI